MAKELKDRGRSSKWWTRITSPSNKWFNAELKRQCDRAWLLFAITVVCMLAYSIAFLWIIWEVQWPEYIATGLMALGVFFLGRISALEHADDFIGKLTTERNEHGLGQSD